MKLLLTADLHGTPADLRLGERARAGGCAMIVIAGDLLDCFGRDLAAQSRAAAAWLRELTATVGQVVVCSGNHDPDGPEGAGWLRRASENLPAGTLTVDGGHAVCGDMVVSVVPFWNRYDDGEEHHQRLRARAEEVWREGRQIADRHGLSWAVVHHEPSEGLAVAAGAGGARGRLGLVRGLDDRLQTRLRVQRPPPPGTFLPPRLVGCPPTGDRHVGLQRERHGWTQDQIAAKCQMFGFDLTQGCRAIATCCDNHRLAAQKMLTLSFSQNDTKLTLFGCVSADYTSKTQMCNPFL